MHVNTSVNEPLIESERKRRGGRNFDCLLCGDDRRVMTAGKGTTVAVKLCGSTNITFTEDVAPGSRYRIIMVNLCGDTKLYVPKGTRVDLRRVALCGNRNIDIDERIETEETARKISVTIVQLCGNVRIMNIEDLEED